MDEIDWGEVAKEMKVARDLPRKYANFFSWHKKEVMELNLCAKLVKFLHANEAGRFERITEGEDPPDCVVLKDGYEIAVEVTEIVDQGSIEKQIQDGIDDFATWPKSKLIASLNKLIEKKDNPNNKTQLREKYSRYILLIHTDETELSHDQFVLKFEKNEIVKTSLIDEVYLLFSYDPRMKTCPIFRVS